MTSPDDSHLDDQQPAAPEPASDSLDSSTSSEAASSEETPAAPAAPTAPPATGSSIRPVGASDGSSVDDMTPTRTYEGQLPHVQDPTVISEGPLITPPELLAGPPLQLRDIGRALVGQRLGHFQLGEFVGGGGMGAVFRATDTELERTVAVKVLTQRYGGKEDTVRRFRVEAQSAARLNHENIATVYFVGEDKGWNFIVFEFIEGENIRDLIARDGPMDVASALSCAAQVAAALQHAAERQVVHRDIKPSNVLLTPNGKAKLVDMGLARLRQVETRDDDLTVSGVTLGTFDYISPEQGRDPRNADVRSDLYSLGCTLYYMLTGQPPYPDRTVLQKLLSHTSDPAPDPRVLRPDLPDDVADLTLRLLEKLPKNRYQDPAVLVRDIVASGERNGFAIGIKRPRISPPVVAQPTALLRSLPWLLPTIVLLVSVFALDGFLDSSGGATNSLPEIKFDSATSGIDSSVRDTGADVRIADLATSDNAGIDNVTWPPGGGVVEDAIGQPDLEKLINTEFSARTLFPDLEAGPSASSGFLDENGFTFDGSPIVRSPTSPFTVSDPPRTERDAMPTVDASVDVVVAQATEVDTLESASGSDGYQVVTTVPEALAIVAADPTLTHIQLRTNYALVDPIQISAEDLTISAADGFDPILRFATEDDAVGLGASDSIGMIEIKTGKVTFEGIHFEFDTWSYGRSCSLFVLGDAELLSLVDGWVRIIGDPSEVVAYERSLVSVSPVSDEADLDSPIPVIQLRNVVFGGEATILSLPESRPLRIDWKNGLIATSRAFAEIRGGEVADDNQIKIDLDHVTAVLDQGLCRCIASESLPHLPTVDLHVTRSILVAPESQPLIVSSGYAQDTDQLESHMLFEGNRNFYEGTEIFWEKMQQPRGGMPLLMPVRMEFDEWQRRRENDERRWHRDEVVWQNAADPNLPRHLTKPEDFMLRDVPNNPARGAGGGVERSDAGFQSSRLPPSPSELR